MRAIATVGMISGIVSAIVVVFFLGNTYFLLKGLRIGKTYRPGRSSEMSEARLQALLTDAMGGPRIVKIWAAFMLLAAIVLAYYSLLCFGA